MVAECLIVAASAVTVRDAGMIEFLKSKHLELAEEEKQSFAQQNDRRFVHFTSKENAYKIMESGFLIPTKGVLANHFTRTIDDRGKKKNAEMVYMFDSANFSVDDYIRNLPRNRSPFNGCYEYYAVSTRPDEHEINNFKRRAQDGAIMYEGRLDIDGTDTKLVKYVLGLDKNGEYELKEVPLNYEYRPTQELLDRLSKDKVGVLKYNLIAYMSEIKKARSSLKKYKVQKAEYKEQIRKRREFVKANKQFIDEQKEKSFVYEKDGRKIVVKNIQYEQVGGKKLQRLAIIENNEETRNKKISDSTKFCYMDEFNIEDIDSRVATEYFFGNLDRIKAKQSVVPEYIGLPIENLETGEVTNEYDTTVDKTFRQYMERRQRTQDNIQSRYFGMDNNSLKNKLKAAFTRIFGRKTKAKLLEAASAKNVSDLQEREALIKLGYSSVEAMNRDDKDAQMFSFLQNNMNSAEAIDNYNLTYSKEMPRDAKEQVLDGTMGEI